MDTISAYKNEFELSERIWEITLTISVFLFLVLTNFASQPPIFANDLIANTTISAPTLIENARYVKEEINPQLRREIFEQRISQKYKGYTVNKVSDGIAHVQMVKYYSGRPVRINVVEVNPKVASDYEIMPATASNKVLNTKATVRTIANRTNSIVAINGGFFKPQNGVPLGTLMINQKIYTGPVYDRVALGIFENGYDIKRLQLNAKISGNNQVIKIDNINQPRMLSSYVLAYTKDWGSIAPVSPRYGVQLQIAGNKIIKASANPLSIPENGYVIVGPKSQLGKLFGAKSVDIQIGTNPQWENVKHIISGGPYLVKDNEIFVDITAEKLQAIGGRNPRTAIGYTKDNDLILIAADGREGSSIGLTLYELAGLMKSLGCINAINLDGGGSTVMYVNGRIVNHPAQTGGIALSNAIVISKRPKG